MPLNWTTTNEQALRNGIKLAVHGRSGAGKTRLIATAPAPLILSAEGGTLSIAGSSIPMLEIRTTKDLDDALTFIQSSSDAKRFQTIALDSFSEIGERILMTEKATAKDPRQAYGAMQEQLAIYVRKFRDIVGKNVYFTVKTELRDQPDGTKLYGASMPGQKTGAGLAYFFDEFFYLDVRQVRPGDVTSGTYRCLVTQQDTLCEAKDRSGVLDAVEEPNLTKIFAKIMGALTPP